MTKIICVAMALALCAGTAFATTYTNSGSVVGEAGYFGYPNTTGFGEIFTLNSEQELQDWRFFGGSPGSMDLEIAAFNKLTDMTTGSPLYISAPAYGYPDFQGINTDLSPGTYIAYVTVATPGSSSLYYITDAVHDLAVHVSTGAGGIGAGSFFCDSSGIDPIFNDCNYGSPSGWIELIGGHQFEFTADLTAVPEPSTLGLLCVGLVGLSLAYRSRVRNAKRPMR